MTQIDTNDNPQRAVCQAQLQSAQIKLTDGQEKVDRVAITNVFQDRQGRWVLKLAHAILIG